MVNVAKYKKLIFEKIKGYGCTIIDMDDINEACGNEDDYYDGNVIYIDTLDKKKRVSEKLKEWKR